MVTTRNKREDVVRAAGRLFADRGYHGTSMRDLGKELGMLGSSLYAHVDSKQDLLVDVVEEGFRSVIRDGMADGSFSSDADPKTASIFILSVLNAIERWYSPEGELDRDALVSALSRFARGALE